MKKLITFGLLFLSFSFSFAQNIYKGQTMTQNRKYFSPRANYYLIFQRDGNLVMYNTRSREAVWDSRTTDSGDRAVFQDDGNFVIYDRSNTPIFSMNTQGKGQDLKIQDDGNFVLYMSNSRPIWSSMENKANRGEENNRGFSTNSVKTGYVFIKNHKIHSLNGEYHLVFQEDGNLVVYTRNKTAIWDSKTTGSGVRAEFQSDGNLVIYNRRGQPVYSTKTTYRGGDVLKMQDDGNLVIYNREDSPIWASRDNK